MSDFVKVCAVEDLIPDSGLAALVGDTQVALFYMDDEVYAVSNQDPLTKAFVMSRGFCGDLHGELMCASPLMKEHYNLRTGECMDKEGVSLPVYEAKIEDGSVFVKVPA